MGEENIDSTTRVYSERELSLPHKPESYAMQRLYRTSVLVFPRRRQARYHVHGVQGDQSHHPRDGLSPQQVARRGRVVHGMALRIIPAE